MKKKRYAPWMYISLAMLIFVVVMLASARITTSLPPLPEKISWDKLFDFQDDHSIFMPILSQSSTPEEIIIEEGNGDNGLGVQDWAGNASP